MMEGNQKTVLFYTDTPIIGGAENQMYLLAKFLNKEKYNVILACSHDTNLNDWTHKFNEEDMEVVRLNVAHKHDPRHYFQLKELIKQRGVDMVHLHVWNPASCRYAFAATNKYNVPTVITEHDPFELKGIKNLIKKRSLKNVAHVIAVSDANRYLMLHLFPELENKITTVHNGIDITWFESQNLSFTEQKRKDFREQKIGSDQGCRVILCVAELHERKGLGYLIKAFSMLRSEGLNTKLVLAGSGPRRDYLEKLAREEGVEKDIIFLGFHKNIPHLMAACDYFVLPSIKEAFGLVLVEAMVAGLPIIASEVGGIPEVVEAGETGLLVPPENPDQIARAIKQYINEPNTAVHFAQNAYDKAKEKFDAKSMAKKTEAIYDEVLSNHHS